MSRKCVRGGGTSVSRRRAMFVPQCIGVVMDDCTKFITHCDEKNVGECEEKSVAMATSIERSQPYFISIIYAHN